MANKSPQLAWDSTTFLDCLQKTPGEIAHIEPMVRDGEAGKLIIICSTMAIAEVLKLKDGTGAEYRAIEQFFNNSYIERVALDKEIAAKARDIRRHKNCKLRSEDAVHLATAIITECSALITTDGDKPKGSSAKKLLTFHNRFGIEILTPKQWTKVQFPLLGGSP